MVLDTFSNLSAVCLVFCKVLSFPNGKNLEFPINSSTFIEIFFGNASNATEANKISLKCINSTVYPLEMYANTIFPNANPTITPIFPYIHKSHIKVLNPQHNHLS